MAYTPKPIDTEHIQLTDDIIELTEKLGEHAHEIWAQQRMKEGWTYGPKRNDETKQHSGLVPYSELSDSEKEYDRIIAMKNLKAIIALGYKIVKK